MNTNKFFKYISFCAVPMLMSSCSNSADEPISNGMEDFEGIVLSIPSDIFTRSTSSNNEAYINTLTVFAYPKVENGKEIGVKKVVEYQADELSSFGINLNNNSKYSQIPIALKPGQYHIYVIANLPIKNTTAYINNSQENWGMVAENDRTISGQNIPGLASANIQNMYVIYPDELSANGSTRKYLPMSCDYTNIKTSATASTGIGDNYISFASKEHIQIYADLTFAVAKVRMSLVNGANSELALKTNSESKAQVQLKNSVQQVGLMKAKENIAASYNPYLTGSYCTYPSGFSISDDKRYEIMDNLEPSATRGDKWAWQGTWYIPERIFNTNTSSEKTTLNLEFNNSAYDKKDILIASTKGEKEGVHRGVYYDIIGYTTSKDLTLEVRVKDWQYHKYSFDLEED